MQKLMSITSMMSPAENTISILYHNVRILHITVNHQTLKHLTIKLNCN